MPSILLAGPAVGIVVDRIGGRAALAAALVLLAIGFGLYPLITEPWHAFGAAAVAWPLISQMRPDAATIAAGAPVDFDLGGQGEIRTLDTGFTGMPVFETGAFSHSATCPG